MPIWFPGFLGGYGPRRLLRLAGALCLGLLLLLAALLAVPLVLTLLGSRAYIVYGGSMGSALANGSVAVTRTVDRDSLEVDDIVAVEREGRDVPLLHRIIDVKTVGGATAYVTRGDSNESPDSNPLVLEGRGDKVVFAIPYLGYFVHFAREVPGRVFLILLPSLLLLGSFLWKVRRSPASIVAREEPEC